MKESAYKVKNVSTDALIACVIGGISLFCMLSAVIVSYLYDGEGPAVVGLLGMGSFLLSVTGIAFTVSSWKSVDGRLMMKRVAGIINMIPLLLTTALYIMGWI